MDVKEEQHWQVVMKEGVRLYLEQACKVSHSIESDTPGRVVRAYTEFASGYLDDERAVLRKSFDETEGHDQMVHVWDVPVLSACEHHVMPFFGTAHFAYLPEKKVVGLSKIPRFIDILARRLQIQERLTEQIVQVFQSEVMPLGCAVQVTATHTCMSCRGVRARSASMSTTALRGAFRTNLETRQEFLSARRLHA